MPRIGKSDRVIKRRMEPARTYRAIAGIAP